MRKFLSFLAGALMGSLVGATLALLLAPSSGEALRSQIQNRLVVLQDELQKAATEKKIELEKYLDDLRQPQTGATLEE
jgi:gas vesicle protein